jgi:hypothetical protein
MSAVESEQTTPPAEDKRVSADGDDRRDRAVSSSGFYAWLAKYADDRYSPLKEKLDRKAQRAVLGATFSREKIAAYLEYDEDLMTLLTNAEMEWRADMVAKDGLKAHMEVDTSPRYDFRDPTMRRAQTCRYRGASGVCGKGAVPGTVRCGEHGGELVDEVTRRAILMTSYLQIVEASGVAVEALVDVAQHSRNDIARVAAAKEILDRAGLTADLQVTVHIEGDERNERISRLRDRLDSMQKGLQSRAIDAVAREENIVDAEVVAAG